jgi:hypothetical protein
MLVIDWFQTKTAPAQVEDSIKLNEDAATRTPARSYALCKS